MLSRCHGFNINITFKIHIFVLFLFRLYQYYLFIIFRLFFMFYMPNFLFPVILQHIYTLSLDVNIEKQKEKMIIFRYLIDVYVDRCCDALLKSHSKCSFQGSIDLSLA